MHLRTLWLIGLLGVSGGALAVDTPLAPSIWAARPDAAAFERSVDGHLATARRRIASLVAVKAARTPTNTLAPYDEAVREINTAANFANVVQQVHPDAALRDRATQAFVRASALQTEIQLDPRVYRALAGLDLKRVDAVTRHYLTRQLLLMRLAGVDKDSATRAELRALNDQLTELISRFDRNISDDERHLSVDPAELDGLPADYVARHAPGADGKVTITTAYPDSLPVIGFARSASLRTRLWIEFVNRGYPRNAEVLAKMLKARERVATLLGYPNWADYSAADKMAGHGAAIGEFIERIAATARPAAEREYALLLAEKRKTEPSATGIADDERRYYAELVRRTSYDFDSQAVRPYFPFARVKQGLFDVAAAFFGVTFEREQNVPFWDSSVESWLVRDHGRLIGRAYLDLHPRPGKFSHAEMDPVRDGVRGRQLPEAILVCNFPRPTAGDPGLMSYEDVQSFFHEFGHLMHHILGGQQPWAGISGITMEADFVEAPSQMLEELLRSPAVLARFARHYETGAPIPADLVARMNRAAAFGRATWLEAQNDYTALSYELHRQPAATVDPDATTMSLARRYTLIAPVTGTHEWASFGHLGGYSSGYYTYLWDKVIALDFFQQFDAADPLSGNAPRRYRQLVLEPGGSQPASDLVRAFLGRPQTTRALEGWMNLEFQPLVPAP